MQIAQVDMRNEVLWNKEAHRTLWHSPPTPTNF